MNNFKRGSVIVFTLLLLVLMCQSVSYSAQISRSVIYDATIEPFGKIDKEIVFPENHDPFYLHVSFLLSPGTITADLSGAVILDQNNGTIMLRGSRGNLSTDGGINFKGSIEMDFVIPVNFYTLLFASPGLVLVDLVFDLPDEVPVDGTVTVFDLGPHWRDSESFNSFLLNGESVKVTAGVRDILSKKLSAVDLAGIIVTSMTGIPPIAVDVAEDVIKIGLGDSRISLNAGLTSNLTLSGEAIIVNGQRVVREGQSIAAPGLDRSRNSYEVNTTYVENFTTVLDLLFSADIELLFNPLGIEMWEYDEPIAELPINVVPERTRELEFRTTPETIIFPIEQTSANRSPQPEGSINVRPLTVGGSAARADVSPYFSDPDNSRLTYSARSRNTSVATVSVSGSEVTITPRSEGSATITITATDPGGLTATQTASVTVQAEQSCEYTLSQSSVEVSSMGGPLQVDVTTTSGCNWRATTSSNFLSLSSSSGTGSGTVSVTVGANTSTRSRSGRLTVAGKTFTIRQDGMMTIASQDLSRGDVIIVQNTLNLGLNIRSGAGTNQPDIGTVFDGATGTIIGGPRSANGYKWWEVDWDNAPTGWSVEAIDEDLLILRRPPDLAIESFRVSESTVDPGEEFTLSLTVRNKGYNESESATLHYYYSSTSKFAATDVVGVVGKDSVGRLDPDDTSKEQISATAPLTPGTYYYGVFLAGTQYIDDGNILNDDDPRNNFAPEKRVKVRKPTFPDLVVESPSVNKDTLAPGESFRLSVTVRNRGAGESRSTRLRYYRSSNSTISTDDTQVETDRVNSLDPDETNDESATLRAPNEPGIYYYGACVDSVRNERDTDNNCSNGVRVTISGSSGSPDLLVENVQVSDSILTSGSSFRVSATVRNRSADSSDSTRLRYYRSSDSTISTGDTEVGTDGVGSISGDGTRDETETLTAPSEAGTYYYGACVDSVRGESKTGNNCSDGIPVVVRALLNQAPEAVGTVPPQTLTEGGSAANVGVSHNFDDPDNDSLTYTATSDNTSVATVSVSDALVTITPQNAGSATITVTASDGTLTATQDITVMVEAAPRVAQTLLKISGDNQQGTPSAALTSPFVVEVWNAAGNPLGGIIVTFAVTAGGGSLSETRVTTGANGQASTTLTLGPNAGTNTVEASVSVIATSLRFTATVETVSNQAPEAVGTILPQTLTIAGSAAGVNVLANFRDPDNDSLTYTVTSNNTGVATVSVSGTLVTITPESAGSATVTVTASDGTLNATQDFTVTVEAAPRSNRSPESVGSISIQTLRVGGSAASVDVSSNFRDPDNDRLTYTTTLDNTRVVTVSVSDATVTIRSQNTGRATITVTASDGTLTATQEIAVTVDAAPRVAQTLVKISGDNQQGPPGEALLSPFIVEVRDTENRGLEGVDVTFAVTAGGGTLSETTIMTDANGQASSRLTLGNNEGENTVRVNVEEISQTLIFYAVGANAINIPDRYLRAKIERALNKRAGAPITAAEMATLTRLDVSNSRISDLTGLKLATNLTSLNLYNNRLTTLPTGVFEGLNKVTTLHLRANPLKTIKAGAFNGLSSLTELDLSTSRSYNRGRLQTLESEAFKGLTNLQSLDLSYNSINTLPTDVFKGLSKVTSLDLKWNPLTTIKTGAFNSLSSLTKLDLSTSRSYNRGRLQTLESEAFKGLTNLQSLNLSYNSIYALPTDVFKGLSKVTLLDLKWNPLTTIKTGAFNDLSSLTELDLSTHRSYNRGLLKTLESEAFKGLTNLQSLNLSYNSINTLPTDVFKGLSKVTLLDLKWNPLTTIKTGAFNGLSSLTKLDLSTHRSYNRGLLKTLESEAFKGLTNLQSLNLSYNSINTLPTDIFKGLSKVQSLDLKWNPLTTIKTGAFNGLSSLTKLDLSTHRSYNRGRLQTLESEAFKGLTNLQSLNLSYNSIYALSTGVFEGLASLLSLDLRYNPGTAFTLVLKLTRTDTTDLAVPGPATIVVQLAQGAPFEMTVNLSVEGGTLSATTAMIARGRIQSEPITMTQSGIRPATVSLETVPRVPSGYSGIRMAVGDSLSTGSILPHSMVKISGDNQQGPAGATLEDPLIVEVRDVANRGLEGVDVTLAVTAGDGSLSDTTVMTDADGHAQSWLALGSQPGTNTVQASVEGLSQTVIFNATIESMEFDLSVPSGTSLIHVPLKVTAVDSVPKTITSIADLYNALGGASTVNLLLTYDPTTQDWLSYFGTFDTGRSADKVLTDDLGIIAGMQVPVTIRLRGNALGTNERSTITLNQGRNLVGLPLRDPRITRVSDLFSLEGIGGNVPVIILTDNGEFKAVGRAGDPGDIPITGGQGFILTAQQAATVAISGEGWTNVLGTTAAPPVTLKGIGVGDTTPVLGLRGSIADEGMGLKVEGFRVTVKNLSTGRAISGITGGERGGYQLNVVDTETGRAATIGDILEISAQSRYPLIGVQPLQYTVTAEDVNRSRIQLETLVAYEIPAETELLPNYPNPFNPETWIPYRLAEDASVTMAIYDQSGRVVRMLDVGYRVAAVYQSRSKAIYWDGRNRFGEPVASGVYFYHLSAGDYSATRRMVIIK